VPTFQTIEQEIWRLIVLRSNTPELLLLDDNRRLSLPCVQIGKGGRVACELSERARSEWNLDVFCLCELAAIEPRLRGAGARCFVLEAICANADIPASARWLNFSDMAMHRLADADSRNAVEAWLRQAAEVHANGVRQRIGDPGTFARIRAWVEQRLGNLGRKLGTEFQQLNAGRDFSLVRFATDRGAVWFKAVGDPNIREFSLALTLADLFPPFAPPILATEPLWNAWLSAEIPGCRLSQREDFPAWRRAAHDLASLQRLSLGRTETILACKAHDLRCSTLLGSVSAFFTQLAEFMARQRTSQPAPLLRAELAELEDELRSSLSELQAEGWPDTLGHLDLNPDNLIVLPERTVFLDWAEASVGHPLFSLAYLLEHFRSRFQSDSHAQLVRAYAEGWQGEKRCQNIERSICRAMFLAIFAHAVSTEVWQGGSGLSTLPVEAYYRSLARRMKTYAARLREGAATVADLWN
jgi:hypothetical protein